jgi:hypothetical protein
VPEQLRLLELFPGIFLVVVGQDGREAVKDVVDKLKESERYRQEWRLKSMLDYARQVNLSTCFSF